MGTAGRICRTLLLACAALASHAATAADRYPVRPVRVVVPFPPGGTVDVVARVVSTAMGEQLGQQLVVDNRAGANGIIGSDLVSKGAPDGHTLLVQASIFVINPMLLKTVPYDVQKDFTAVAHLGSVPLLVTAHPSVPAANLREFIALVKSTPGKYTFATSGLGSAGHLTEETIKRQAGLDILIVPYKGAGPALTDLMGGQVSVMIDPMPSSFPLVRGNRLKALAVTSAKRVSFLPNVPTVSESGLAGFEMVSWYGIWGPPKIPKPLAMRISGEAAKAVRSQLAVDRLADQGFEPVGDGPDAFATYIAKEIAAYARIIKDANIRIE